MDLCGWDASIGSIVPVYTIRVRSTSLGDYSCSHDRLLSESSQMVKISMTKYSSQISVVDFIIISIVQCPPSRASTMPSSSKMAVLPKAHMFREFGPKKNGMHGRSLTKHVDRRERCEFS